MPEPDLLSGVPYFENTQNLRHMAINIGIIDTHRIQADEVG